MRRALIIGFVAVLVGALIAPTAQAATQVRQVRVEIPGPTTTPPTPAGTMTLDFLFKNKPSSKRKFTPRQLTRIDFAQVPLACANNPGEASSVLFFNMTLNTNVKLTKVPPPGGKKPKPGRYAFRFFHSFPTFSGTLRSTIDKPNRPGKRPLRSQGSLNIVDLDADPGHTNCSTRGPKQWGGLPVTRIR
jgi:hypothetical protein